MQATNEAMLEKLSNGNITPPVPALEPGQPLFFLGKKILLTD